MDDVVALASEIETGPASRELSDRVLMAVGWRRVAEGYILNPRAKNPWMDVAVAHDSRPDPLTDLNAIASIERESGALVIAFREEHVTRAGAYIPGGERRFWATVQPGDHAEPRARCAALLRAIAASRVDTLKGEG